MSNSPNLRLFDPAKRGTMIVGCPRFGTHYLESIVHWMARSSGLDLCQHKEIFKDGNPDHFLETLEGYQAEPGYHTFIINSALPKLFLMTRPDILDRWHIIRITHANKLRWFLSWWFFFKHPQSELVSAEYDEQKRSEFLLHHGTSPDVYHRILYNLIPTPMSNPDLWTLQSALSAHQLSHAVPADEQVDYADLKNIKGPWSEWEDNQYPNITLDRLFTNADVVQQILDVWSFEPPAKFREAK